MQKKSFIIGMSSILLVLTIGGCSLGFPGVYRIDIPQGNLVNNSKIADVKVGMEPRQVRYLLGTPLITDSFNQNRWDYFYSLHKDNKTTVEHHVSIFFADGRVAEIKDQLKP
jgi:outer membrane protein assembly factor BamE